MSHSPPDRQEGPSRPRPHPKDPGQYPTVSILSGKRDIQGKGAHLFVNTKTRKTEPSENALPLRLASPPPKSRTRKTRQRTQQCADPTLSPPTARHPPAQAGALGGAGGLGIAGADPREIPALTATSAGDSQPVPPQSGNAGTQSRSEHPTGASGGGEPMNTGPYQGSLLLSVAQPAPAQPSHSTSGTSSNTGEQETDGQRPHEVAAPAVASQPLQAGYSTGAGVQDNAYAGPCNVQAPTIAAAAPQLVPPQAGIAGAHPYSAIPQNAGGHKIPYAGAHSEAPTVASQLAPAHPGPVGVPARAYIGHPTSAGGQAGPAHVGPSRGSLAQPAPAQLGYGTVGAPSTTAPSTGAGYRQEPQYVNHPNGLPPPPAPQPALPDYGMSGTHAARRYAPVNPTIAPPVHPGALGVPPNPSAMLVDNGGTAYIHPDIVYIIQQMYLKQFNHAITAEYARVMWHRFSEPQRALVLQEYDRAYAEAQLFRMQQVPFAQAGYLGQLAGDPPGRFEGVQSMTASADSAPAPQSLPAGATFTRMHQEGPPAPQRDFAPGQHVVQPSVRQEQSWSSLSSMEDLGLQHMEDVIQSETPGAREFFQEPELSHSPVSDHSRSTVIVDKGKRRATCSSGDSFGSLRQDSLSSRGSSAPDVMDTADPGDLSANINPQVTMLMFKQMQHARQAFQESAEAIRESVESNRHFQERMEYELQAIRACMGGSSATPGEDSPSASSSSSHASSGPAKKTTSTRASDRKVEIRLAKATGSELPPTSQELEAAARSKLQERIHAHILKLLGVQDTSTLATKFVPLTEAEIEAFAKKDGTIVCTPEQFRVDFKNAWKRFPFNETARQIILTTFKDTVQAGAFAANPTPKHMLTDENLGSVVDQYMVTLRRKYRSLCNPPNQDAITAAQRAAAQNSRQGTLYRSRRFVILRYPSMHRHGILFNKLSACNMSGDETDGPKVKHAAKYRIILAEWQSQMFRAFLWSLDARYIKHWENPPGQRRSKGNAVRVRILHDESRTVPGTAPKGLWRNCYDAGWLARQGEVHTQMLDIIDEDYNFAMD